MSQEHTNMSAPSRIGSRSPESAGLIDWYDSPKVLFSSQAKISRRSLLLMKTRSAEEFSPSQSFLNALQASRMEETNSDFDSLWCPSTSNENTAPRGKDNTAFDIFQKEDAQYDKSSTTPHRSRPLDRTHTRRKRRSDQNEVAEPKSTDSQGSMTMEEGLALGRASLVKLRQRLRSEGDVKDSCNEMKHLPYVTPTRTTVPCMPNLTPIPRETPSRIANDITITPSLVRTQPPSTFSTSTPKRSGIVSATPLKRFRTMNDNPGRAEYSPREKIPRTQSMNITNDGSDDDSFLDDIFMPFSNPNQFPQMLKQNAPSSKK